ncbi:MAG: hypothetical protein ACXVYY_01445 [Oryzihumus sp.]
MIAVTVALMDSVYVTVETDAPYSPDVLDDLMQRAASTATGQWLALPDASAD